MYSKMQKSRREHWQMQNVGLYLLIKEASPPIILKVT